jgi:amino acid transporter
MSSPALDRAIGPTAATLLVIGGIIGSGIFLTTGLMAASLPSPVLILTAWALGGLFALAGALSYAELAAMFPRAGGVYVYLREAFGSLPAFLYGWAMLLVALSGGVAAVAVGFADYLSYFFPSLSPAHVLATVPIGSVTWTLTAAKIVAVLSIVALGGINYLGVRSGAGTNAVLTVAKIAGLLLIPIFAIAAPRVSPEWTPIVPPDVPEPLVAFGVAMIAVLWANDGFYFLTYSAGEVRDPTRNLPRALTFGLLTVIAIYLTVNHAYLVALPMSELAKTSRVAERAATALVGTSGATLVSLTVVFSTFGCNAAAILASSRLLYAMAADGLFFAAAKSTRATTARVAILASRSGRRCWPCQAPRTAVHMSVHVRAVQSIQRPAPFSPWLPAEAPPPYRVWAMRSCRAFVLGSVFVVANTL